MLQDTSSSHILRMWMHRRRDGSIITAARAVAPADIGAMRALNTAPYMNGRVIYSPLTFTLYV